MKPKTTDIILLIGLTLVLVSIIGIGMGYDYQKYFPKPPKLAERVDYYHNLNVYTGRVLKIHVTEFKAICKREYVPEGISERSLEIFTDYICDGDTVKPEHQAKGVTRETITRLNSL